MTSHKEAEEELDRLGQLPGIIDRILSFLPFKEAVRTSVLSSNWRYQWTMHPEPELVFDDHQRDPPKRSFFGNKSSLDAALSEWEKMKYRVLLFHPGPIRKFMISSRKVPPVPEVERLISCLSRPPSSGLGGAFKNLRTLELSYVEIAKDLLEKLISSCPLLEKVRLICLSDGVAGLAIDAPKLYELKVENCVRIHGIHDVLSLNVVFRFHEPVLNARSYAKITGILQSGLCKDLEGIKRLIDLLGSGMKKTHAPRPEPPRIRRISESRYYEFLKPFVTRRSKRVPDDQQAQRNQRIDKTFIRGLSLQQRYRSLAFRKDTLKYLFLIWGRQEDVEIMDFGGVNPTLRSIDVEIDFGSALLLGVGRSPSIWFTIIVEVCIIYRNYGHSARGRLDPASPLEDPHAAENRNWTCTLPGRPPADDVLLVSI
ncbi:hypothetical protein CRG98_026170 [Punica granatum]|uniref:F-box domain-containing protein n=1 Tax=Punica granatum TaxID=22663 RepID=A0A2I0JC26_PUNGR|nr:hypothetical protein CRG98_026170 [Punica granatum]